MAGQHTPESVQRANMAALSRAYNNIRALAEVIPGGVMKALDEVGEQTVARIVEMVDTPYPPASDPGSAPHRRTGTLQRGYDWEVVKGSRNESHLNLTNEDAEYWEYLEFGTRNMAPRPHVRPAMRSARDSLGAKIVGGVTVAQRARAAGMRSF